MSLPCGHATVVCVNQYETVRKYECAGCRAIMMCACDEAFGRRHLPHQLGEGQWLENKDRVRVTHGFQPRICNTCRGIPEIAAPKAELHGATSKIHRYYWREHSMRSMERFAAWAEANGFEYRARFRHKKEHRMQYAKLSREVWDELKAEHQRAPKYVYKERSSEEVLKANHVTIVNLDGTYARGATKGSSIVHNKQLISVEAFATLHLQSLGYTVLATESVPFHVLFGSLLSSVVCDEEDPNLQIAQFASRDPADRGTGSMVTAYLPSDFGSIGYGARRADAIDELLARIGCSSETLMQAFDDGFGDGWALRQYLWAHRLESAETALELLRVLPADRIVACMRYLAANYWRHFVGWPDLLAHRADDYFFAEIKGSGDKLSEDQKNWIDGNTGHLNLPFKLIRVHRRHVVDLPSK